MPSRTMKIALLGSGAAEGAAEREIDAARRNHQRAAGVAARAGAGEDRGSDIARLFIHGQIPPGGSARARNSSARRRRLGRHRALQRGDIGRNCLHILLLRPRHIIGHRLHRPRPPRRARRPSLDADMRTDAARPKAPARGTPAFRAGAYQSSAPPPANSLPLASAPRKLRGVWQIAAMPQSLDQISAAVPLR